MFVFQWKSAFLVDYFKRLRMKAYSCIWIKVTPYNVTMLQVGCRGCLVDVWVLYFPKNNFLPLAFKLSTKSHGICVQWRSIESLDMWKSLLWANRKSLRFCPAISTLFRQGFPLEFANLKYFSFVGLLSRHWVKFGRQEAHNDSSPSIFLYL